MILYTKNLDKISCIRTEQPKISNKNNYWDCFIRNIDEIPTRFWFTVKNNRSWFYFTFNGDWYKTKIVTDDCLDLWNYLYEDGKELIYEQNIQN